MMDTKLVSWALGIWASVTFLLCVVYGLIAPENLHAQALLEQLLPAFQWLTWPGFLLGLAESFLYGAYAGLVFCPVYNWLNRRWGRGQMREASGFRDSRDWGTPTARATGPLLTR